MIYVTLQHPSPYYDDSYGVNSENNGPFGDAILQELIPAVEAKFRVIREPWARTAHSADRPAAGCSSRSRSSIPTSTARACASCPDSVDFRYHQIVNVYSDANAYFVDKGWTKVERPTPAAARRQHHVDDEGRELVRARRAATSRARAASGTSGKPPTARVGADGYPQRHVGQANRRHRQEGGRLLARALRPARAPRDQLGDARPEGRQGKLHIYVGDDDSFYLDNARRADGRSSWSPRRRPTTAGA